MKKYLLLVFLSFPVSSDVNTPFNLYPILTDLQIYHRPFNGFSIIRYTDTEGNHVCQKVNVNDLNNAMKQWYSDTGDQFISMGTWFYNVTRFLPPLSITSNEAGFCHTTWK